MPVRLGINSTRGAISSAQSCIIRSSARAAPVVSRQAFHERRQELSTSASAEQAAPQSSASGSSPSTSAKVAAAETQAPSSPSKLLSGFAKLLGYNHNSATAIRSTNYYYDRICNRDKQQEKEFWYEECGLPDSFTSWFHITNLHIYLLTVRFRALPHPLGRYFNQQLINHFFIDAEQRLQAHTSRSQIVQKTLKDCLEQYHGSFMAYDEAILTKSDAVLAAALWRNVFAGAWAGSISVDGNKAPVGQKKLDISQADVEAQKAELKRLGITPAPSAAPSESNSEPNVTASDSSAHQMEDPLSAIAEQAQFAVSLEKLVVWMRRETYRLDNLSDTFVAAGKLVDRQSPTLDFTPISGGLGQVASAKK